ncbi:porin family protein [Cytophaga sp. FL35]|uniref:porin family protein n=1 Tax=Cytophaga sp. FL35 TaxID=1904456 RepID=UPI0016539141|nr:porin family protein [Cytophaga sp. FL35]MBC6999986.1 PorT family protein [Cytophaga sp. FL35]
MRVNCSPCILVFLFFSIAINAQTVFQGTGPSGSSFGDVKIGGKAGLHVATWMGEDVSGVSQRLGFYAGGIAEIPMFMDDLYLQPELLISLVGADIGPSNVNLTYLTLPLMGKFHIIEEVAVEFGPQVGFLLSDNWEEDLQGQDTKKMDIGLNFGGGYRMNENIYFQMRFGFGLGKVLDITKVRNGVFSIGGSYFF